MIDYILWIYMVYTMEEETKIMEETEEFKKQLKEKLYKFYWLEELSLFEISVRLNIPQSTILMKMRKFGIPRRQKGWKWRKE